MVARLAVFHGHIVVLLDQIKMCTQMTGVCLLGRVSYHGPQPLLGVLDVRFVVAADAIAKRLIIETRVEYPLVFFRNSADHYD